MFPAVICRSNWSIVPVLIGAPWGCAVCYLMLPCTQVLPSTNLHIDVVDYHVITALPTAVPLAALLMYQSVSDLQSWRMFHWMGGCTSLKWATIYHASVTGHTGHFGDQRPVCGFKNLNMLNHRAVSQLQMTHMLWVIWPFWRYRRYVTIMWVTNVKVCVLRPRLLFNWCKAMNMFYAHETVVVVV